MHSQYQLVRASHVGFWDYLTAWVSFHTLKMVAEIGGRTTIFLENTFAVRVRDSQFVPRSLKVLTYCMSMLPRFFPLRVYLLQAEDLLFGDFAASFSSSLYYWLGSYPSSCVCAIEFIIFIVEIEHFLCLLSVTHTSAPRTQET